MAPPKARGDFPAWVIPLTPPCLGGRHQGLHQGYFHQGLKVWCIWTDLLKGTLLWMDLTQKDDDGFITTETDQLERDSYAIVTEPADIDLDEGWNVGWGWGWAALHLAGRWCSHPRPLLEAP